ncbi:MAG: 2'-deoxycytidine 5'-triphosphate deaminase [Hyphomicrobiaceae bacterium]|nr:2'-deoxycytidine 5'-triphosphate deaminase [Hyphomicrobiaceae bacterium]
MSQSDASSDGILPAQAIRRLLADRAIETDAPLAAGQVQPASIDLRLGDVAYRVRASFLPGPDEEVGRKLRDLTLHVFDLTEGAVLETGCVYVVPLLESLSLPAHVAAAANPKSSTGRLDVFTRVIADRVDSFDTIPAGYRGRLYAEICPQTFPVVVRRGSYLSQLRFRVGDPIETDKTLLDLQGRLSLVSGGVEDIKGGVALSVDLAGGSDGLIGYRAKRHTGLVDVDHAGACAIADYWEPIRDTGRRRLILDPEQFYILASKEAVHVPPTHAAEMMPFNPLVGEFRVHYAGFMDPGFGHAPAGGAGARVVLEVRSHKVPFTLEDGQIIGRLVYERMTEPPDVLYGAGLNSNYQAQGLKLSKHFRA